MPHTTDWLHTLPLLHGLADDQIDRLASIAKTVTFAVGDRIFVPDEPATACWLLRTGRIALDTPMPTGAPVVVETLGPGDVLGWSWLIPPHRWHFGAVAVEQTTALELDATKLLAWFAVEPAFGYLLTYRFLSVMLDRLQHTRARLLDLYRNDGHGE